MEAAHPTTFQKTAPYRMDEFFDLTGTIRSGRGTHIKLMTAHHLVGLRWEGGGRSQFPQGEKTVWDPGQVVEIMNFAVKFLVQVADGGSIGAVAVEDAASQGTICPYRATMAVQERAGSFPGISRGPGMLL